MYRFKTKIVTYINEGYFRIQITCTEADANQNMSVFPPPENSIKGTCNRTWTESKPLFQNHEITTEELNALRKQWYDQLMSPAKELISRRRLSATLDEKEEITEL